MKNTDIANNIFAVIVAGGKGTRLGGDIPKQFLDLHNRPVLMRTLDTFRKVIPEDRIVTVVAPSMIDYWKELCGKHGFYTGPVTAGGETRWHSSKNGITFFAPFSENDKILIHDAARVGITTEIIREVISALRNGHDGAIPVIPVADSIRKVRDDESFTIDRKNLRAVQTPQGFDASKLSLAYDMPFSENFTDDASVMQQAGYNDIALTQGSRRNFKITDSWDLQIARTLFMDDEGTV